MRTILSAGRGKAGVGRRRVVPASPFTPAPAAAHCPEPRAHRSLAPVHPWPGRARRTACAAERVEVEDAGPVTSRDSPPSATKVSVDVGPQQRALVALCALVALICAVDRAAMSVAILPMTKELHWSEATQGAVSSAFFLGYTATNPIAGTLASRGSAKTILAAGVVVWSLFTMATPVAATSGSLETLLLCRLLMGFGEGVTFPTIQAMMAAWIPSKWRSRALASTYAGAQAGTIVSLVTAPAIIAALSWPAVFVVYGGVGFVWLAAWLRWVEDEPPVRIEGTRDSSTPAPKLSELPWRQMLTSAPFLSLLLAHMTWAVGHYTILAWLPSYYSQQYGLDTAGSAFYSVLPWVCTVLCTNLGGWAADSLINAKVLSTGQTRKLMNSVAFLAPAVALLALSTASPSSPTAALAFMTAALALGGFSGAGFASNHQDIASRTAPLLFGITNASSSIAGTTAVYLTGVWRDTGHTWGDIWGAIAVVYVVGAVVYLAGGSGKRQFE